MQRGGEMSDEKEGTIIPGEITTIGPGTFKIAYKFKAQCDKCGYEIENDGHPFGFLLRLYNDETDFCIRCIQKLFSQHCGLMKIKEEIPYPDEAAKRSE